MLMLMLIVDVE